MKATTRLLAALAAGALALSAAPAAAQRDVENAPDPWVHAATSTPFPARVGEFRRTNVHEFSADGRDASASYALRRDGKAATVTLYVYPAHPGATCEATFAEVKRNIAAHKGAELVSEGRAPAPSGGGGPAALHARYRIPAGSIRPDIPEVRSDGYLYCPAGGEWLVKYRATWPIEADFSADVEKLLHSIAWPGKLGG